MFLPSILIASADLAGRLTPPPAYLDPGSGSFILQLLVAGILGGLVALRMSWSKLKARFTRRPEGSDDASTPPEDKSGE
jgi:hypothetical protein